MRKFWALGVKRADVEGRNWFTMRVWLWDYLCGSKRFLQTTKILNFSVHSRKFKTRKILFWPIRESLSREMQKFHEFFGSRKFLLLKYNNSKITKKIKNCIYLRNSPLLHIQLYIIWHFQWTRRNVLQIDTIQG